MSQFSSLKEIVQEGFCIGCGMCQSIAPNSAIKMRPAAHGHLRPIPTKEMSPEEELSILQLCPGINVDGPFDNDECQPDVDPVWGQALRVARGHASDEALRYSSSSGGVMTAINKYLLRTGYVNFVLQAIPDPEDPYGSIPAICRTEQELLSAKGSRYASAATLSSIKAVLDLGEPFAVSLKPCDIAGVRNLQRQDPRARELIRFTQAMICGSVPSVSALEGFFDRRQLDFALDKPLSFRWRGNGCPGPAVAEMSDGRVFEGTYNELWDENPWSTQFRCKVCPDAIGLQADIVVGDDWPNAVPAGEDAGWNVVVARTDAGLRILKACESQNELKLFHSTVKRLNETQPHHENLRRSLKSRLQGADSTGMHIPNFSNLALQDCSDQLTLRERDKICKGAADRVRAGHGDSDSWADYGEGNPS